MFQRHITEGEKKYWYRMAGHLYRPGDFLCKLGSSIGTSETARWYQTLFVRICVRACVLVYTIHTRQYMPVTVWQTFHFTSFPGLPVWGLRNIHTCTYKAEKRQAHAKNLTRTKGKQKTKAKKIGGRNGRQRFGDWRSASGIRTRA